MPYLVQCLQGLTSGAATGDNVRRGNIKPGVASTAAATVSSGLIENLTYEIHTRCLRRSLNSLEKSSYGLVEIKIARTAKKNVISPETWVRARQNRSRGALGAWTRVIDTICN